MLKLILVIASLLVPSFVYADRPNISPMEEIEQLLMLESIMDENDPDYIHIVDAISDRSGFLASRAKGDIDYILVNIGSQRLDIIDDLELTSSQKVIVGRDSRRTPVFTDVIKYIVSRPYWNVPRSLAERDVLPKLRENPRDIERHGFEMVRVGTTEVVHPFDLNMDLRKYRIRQRPGKHNALGDVKFMFDPHPKRAIYLHDTPSKYLFDTEVRRHSSGCIRVENPGMIELFLMKDVDIKESEQGDRWVRTPVETKVHIVDWPVYFHEGELIITENNERRVFKLPTFAQYRF